ncbi:hypothetical protein F4778DRAFT_755355 [Xylariomycetidae sp. FL2044]|nr:hypothetical protein F4778DRAFT_755355 [Xylariomycetidae sp. FL2044]
MAKLFLASLLSMVLSSLTIHGLFIFSMNESMERRRRRRSRTHAYPTSDGQIKKKRGMFAGNSPTRIGSTNKHIRGIAEE